jgi:RNA polymerase sigma factor (sigma-70 family)
MNVHFSYKASKTPDIEKDIDHQVEKLRKRLQVFRPELVHLKGLVEQSSPREGFLVSLNLRLPSGQMAVQKSGASALGVVRAAFDDLLQQITKHKDQLRSSHKWPRRRRNANGRSQRQVPFEETIAAVPLPTISSDDIRGYVNANLSRLERFVEREILFREATDLLSPDSVTREEVIDECIVRAMGDGVEKPERLALEPWLYRLAIRVLDDLASSSREEEGSVHLEESARNRNVRGSDEPQLQFHQPDETLTEENIIPDSRVATPEQIASSDEMMAMVVTALRGADRTAREAFILNGIEGFTLEEIAAITDRRPDEVRASIASAREHLKKFPPVANRFREKLLQKTSV